MMSANLKGSDRLGSAIKKHPAVLDADERAQSGDYGYIVVGVFGRLDDGPPGHYRLKLAYPNDVLGCNDFAVAALSANRNGGGRIATRQGTLEILSSEIVIGSWNKLGVIDPNRGTIAFSVAPYWERESWDGSAVVTKSGDLFWRVREVCLDLNGDGRFLPMPDENCVSLSLTRQAA